MTLMRRSFASARIEGSWAPSASVPFRMRFFIWAVICS